MDPFKLLSRSTKLSTKLARPQNQPPNRTPSTGHNAKPRLTGTKRIDDSENRISKKRKHEEDSYKQSTEPDFFAGAGTARAVHSKDGNDHANVARSDEGDAQRGEVEIHEDEGDSQQALSRENTEALVEDTKAILKRHKIKSFWLNPSTSRKKVNKVSHKIKTKRPEKRDKIQIYPPPIQTFRELQERYNITSRLLDNIENEGFSVPTEVQLGSLALLLDGMTRSTTFQSAPKSSHFDVDLLTVAPTGSGKTLAFMIPLLHKIKSHRFVNQEMRKTFAMILAPTKELAAQIVNEARKLSCDTGIKVTLVKKGMKIAVQETSTSAEREEHEAVAVKSDILVSTPGVLASLCREAVQLDKEALRHVRYLVLDEADVLLDPLFREQTLSIWKLMSNVDLRVSLWSATMGSNIEELAQSVIEERRTALASKAVGDIYEAPIVRLVVGLKDTALPNVQHRLVYAASEQGKLMGIRQLLHPATSSPESGAPLLPPFLVFTQTIERAAALHSELRYDIPVEAGGISRIAVLHSNLSDSVRDDIMTRFRKAEIWVLITTDLLSRGIDFRGVNGVVNYDIPTSSAAYVHRAGRTGRAGREGGVAVTLYTEEDVPYLKPIANLISVAQKHANAPEHVNDRDGVQKWMLDALPNLGKKAKHDLKRRGIESRTTRARIKDPQSARRAKISTKSGFRRREENRRLAAISSSKARACGVADASDEDEPQTDFAGFD